jgi:hypothetical protein
MPEPKTEREVDLYYDGVKEGLIRFAWWKDGQQFVGTCGTPLMKALSDLFEERREAIDNIPLAEEFGETPYCPEIIKESLIRYVQDRVPTGDFLQAVLENDLMEALGRADPDNREHIFGICYYIYNYTPHICHGSPEKVKKWLERKE